MLHFLKVISTFKINRDKVEKKNGENQFLGLEKKKGYETREVVIRSLNLYTLDRRLEY